MKTKIIFLLILFIVTSVGYAEREIPMPPGWKDTSNTIEIWRGKVTSNQREGYSWSMKGGMDFDVIYFQDIEGESSSAGGYVGNHTKASIAVTQEDMGSKFGKLNGVPVVWVKRPSLYGYKYKYETVITLKEKSENSPELKFHFWINIVDSSEDDMWLKWAESVKIEE